MPSITGALWSEDESQLLSRAQVRAAVGVTSPIKPVRQIQCFPGIQKWPFPPKQLRIFLASSPFLAYFNLRFQARVKLLVSKEFQRNYHIFLKRSSTLGTGWGPFKQAGPGIWTPVFSAACIFPTLGLWESLFPKI